MAKVSFKPPAGVVPESTDQDDTFDLVCTFLLESGGTVCLTKMGDTDMPGYGDAAQATKKPAPYRQEASDMAASAPEAPDYG